MSLRDEPAAMALLWRAVRSDLPGHELTPFRTSGRLSVDAAISIYKNAYWIRQHEVLCDLFPRLTEALGARAFRDVVRRYLLAHPSCHPELEHLGTHLPGFLASQPEHALTGLAALELALVDSALAPDSPVADPSAIRPASFAGAHLVVSASLRVVILDERALHVLHAEDREIVGAYAAVAVRSGFATRLYLIGHDEHATLELARQGRRIQELLDHHADDVSGLHRFLRRWFDRGWIAAIEEEPS